MEQQVPRQRVLQVHTQQVPVQRARQAQVRVPRVQLVVAQQVLQARARLRQLHTITIIEINGSIYRHNRRCTECY